MRLYLSSFRIGNCPDRLVALARGGRRAAVIANATDVYPPDGRTEAVAREIEALTDLGFDAAELDLREYFDTSGVQDALREHDLIWVRGGDVFTLRYTLARSGADIALIELLAEDEVAYGGYSAGPCVLGPSLVGLDEVDNPAWVKSLYGADPIFDGLGVLDYCIVPHVGTPEHPESAACERLAERYRREGTPHKAIRDGQVLIVDGETTSVVTRPQPG